MSALLPLIPLHVEHPLMLLFQAQCLFQLNYPNLNEAAYCANLLRPEHFPNSIWIRTLRAKILFNLHGEGLGRDRSADGLTLHRARRI
jgi:anaphase-promoting complex subunit 8